MSYRPERRQTFGPPVASWILPAIYFLVSIAFLAVVLVSQMTSGDSWLHRYIVEGDEFRILGARTLAGIMALGGIAALIRTAMRGVIVHPDGVEARYVISFGWPKVQSYTWMEIDRLVFQQRHVVLSLWDGTRFGLPEVRDHEALSAALERVAIARAIPIVGGSGKAFDDE